MWRVYLIISCLLATVGAGMVIPCLTAPPIIQANAATVTSLVSGAFLIMAWGVTVIATVAKMNGWLPSKDTILQALRPGTHYMQPRYVYEGDIVFSTQ